MLTYLVTYLGHPSAPQHPASSFLLGKNVDTGPERLALTHNLFGLDLPAVSTSEVYCHSRLCTKTGESKRLGMYPAAVQKKSDTYPGQDKVRGAAHFCCLCRRGRKWNHLSLMIQITTG